MAVVIWSDKAKQDLRSIHSYYYVNSSPLFAARLLMDIVDAADILETAPRIAPIESGFEDLGEIRGLLVRQKGKKPQYKLMYMVEEEICYILAVWNTKRNPLDKMRIIPLGLSN